MKTLLKIRKHLASVSYSVTTKHVVTSRPLFAVFLAASRLSARVINRLRRATLWNGIVQTVREMKMSHSAD